MKPFKFFQKEDYFIPRVRRGSGRTIAQDLMPVQPMGPRTRECAVISSSVRDFNNWRNETFDRSSVFIITNRDFLHTNGVSGISTRYKSITRIDRGRGLMFDDYITTDRIEDILLSGYNETIDHIHQLMDEVGLTLRR